MKYVNYRSIDTGDIRAILLCESDEHDVLLLPPTSYEEVPCLVLARINRHGIYEEGSWTNMSAHKLKKLEKALHEAIACGLKDPDDGEYQTYLRLKKKFEKI